MLPEREVAARDYDSGYIGETLWGTLEKKHTVEQEVEERAGRIHMELIIIVAWFMLMSYVLTLNELGKLEA